MEGTESSVSGFAVLLAAYNGIEWIGEQVESILNQTDVEVRLFISVDPSRDGTRDWCESLAARDRRVRVLPDTGRLGSAARNFFRLLRDVDLSEFDYVSLADQDDVWHPDKLATAQREIVARRVDGYSGNVVAYWRDGREVLIDKSQEQRDWDFLFEAAGPGCTYVLTNELATRVKSVVINSWNSMQNVYLHDWFVYAFARANGYRWYIDPTPKMKYRQHDDNQVGINSGIRAYVKRVRTIANGLGLEQARLIASLVGLDGNEFVQSWQKLGRREILRLAGRCRDCRRRPRDQLLFFLVCLFLSMRSR
jgi:rhamnosyltransferase